MPLKVGDVIKMLESDGWFIVRTRGSHRQYRHPTKLGKVTVSGKPSGTLRPGTEASILKQAGLERRRS
jgi:predicted RNA binding protein YcfA (HicA-like mRNA interferase family)